MWCRYVSVAASTVETQLHSTAASVVPHDIKEGTEDCVRPTTTLVAVMGSS